MNPTLRIFDSGAKFADRYTIIPPRNAGKAYRERMPGMWQAIAASREPFHPLGFGQHTQAAPGPHLGKRIEWAALPRDVQAFAAQSFPVFVFDIGAITESFIECARILETESFNTLRISREARKNAREFVTAFLQENAGLSFIAITREEYGWHNGRRDATDAFGHDLFLTAAGHGAGFWDRDALEANGIGDKLTAALRAAYVETENYRGILSIRARLHK